ncbi:uncharacterized protein M421DRAFT_56909 [Didymella exigua CBS 183.55]|uniref:ubiquitinyl hydrolase 1 n=1 Tax=Didymella exigua CBS 183.55 TaxID=1150837 RepID=A0A6A5RWD0_9PLEO|nr:uncharacterized protein M421DRAFT_56909 [Didymella exigua CBS 183.55]KAF1931308.1 hypothetical protein M421DRAFT_56909 [Didymella exigua CBS 183.55]
MAASGRPPAVHVHFNEQLYNHIALPRDVPGREDRNLSSIEAAILTRLTNATRLLSSYAPPSDQQHIYKLVDSLTACQSLHVDRAITKPALLRELRALQPGKILILHIAAQNCGLLVYKDASGSQDDCRVIFEAFEVTPTCEQVLATKNALLRDFPGCAVSVPNATVLEPSFLDSFCTFLQQASTEYVNKFSTITHKAAAPLPEIRNTSDPAVVIGLLMSILEANGATADVSVLRKRFRDTVMFDKAHKPWRRSPFYLTVRVALQRCLYKQFGVDIGRLYYKTLMCLMLRHLLEDVLRKIPFESVLFLRQKLGRRLAKLAGDRTAAARRFSNSTISALSSLDPMFEATLQTTGGWLKTTWRNYKRTHERYVPLLNAHVPAGALNFCLPNAYPMLSHILANQAFHVDSVRRTPEQLLRQYDESAASVKPYMCAARSQIQISQHHATVIEPAKEAQAFGHARIIELNDIIRNYVHQIQTSPEGYPDERSQMLLNLMELWVLMDMEAIACYPLLEDYDSAFPEDLLDPIQLLSLNDMIRAKQVRAHLSRRFRPRNGLKCRTIFDDPSSDCFAARYFDEYDEAGHDLRSEIEDDADAQRTQKEAEWEEKSELHAEIVKKRDETACFYDEVPHGWIPGVTETKHRHPCEWHELRDTARKIKIRIFEHPLPSYKPAAKAAMFELRCPKSFAAYRNATWSILSIICSPEPAIKPERVSILQEYSQLQSHVEELTQGVTLASERKAFLETHYAYWGFPVDLNDIIRNCGLRLKYYDQSSESWTGEHSKASLWHHFPVMLAVDSPFWVLQPSYASWPSSNEIQASQADCPADIGAHEFMAWQGLLVGTHSRWLDLIRELGSANLNFSADATWVLVIRMVLQYGSAVTTPDPRGDVHSALLDQTLCSRLLQQVQQRLDAIRLNWREPIQMDILITILLKVNSLSTSDGTRLQALALLLQARESTDLWRVELQSYVTNDARVRPFAVWAALLCKRTLHADSQILLESGGLQHYIGASISLSYNLVDEFKFLPWKYRAAIIRDVMYSYEHRDLLKRSILSNPQAFLEAVNRLWQVPEGYESNISVSTTGTWWILLELQSTSSSHDHSYFVHYNYVYGSMLIDGQEMCTLPLTYRRNPLYRQIFGDRNPVVFPSPLQGMSWAVSEPMKDGQRVHLGFRQRTLVVRAVQHDQLYEYIPGEVFGVESRDLPAPLIDGCHHWLNIRKGELEIRQQDMWISKPRNWWIYGILYGQCQVIRRSQHHSATTLLNSSNETVQHISTIFRSFVELNQILVFVSRDHRIIVELKPLELSFFINEGGLLQSKRLGAIITQQQDIGTLYGLRSKIVVQSVANRRHKSVLMPYNSDIQMVRDDIHVSVMIGTDTDKYLKYDINEILGRLDCPPEPSLLYTKALLHALTSHVMPDPLTSRTGTEESLRLLQTGLYQPWNPLGPSHVALLCRLAELSPMRGYYPVGSQFMETLEWRVDLTRHIQDDRFRPFAEKILRRHFALSEFAPGTLKSEGMAKVSVKPNSHLATRAVSRTLVQQSREADLMYIGRDKRTPSMARANAFSITRQLLLQQPSPADSPSLLVLLHDASLIGGYDKCFQKALISDLLAVDVKSEWGALTQRAMKCDTQDRYRLMFLLGPMAFSDDANLDLIRKLICFVVSPDIKGTQPPLHAAYFHFRADGAPPSSYLVSFMEKARMPFIAVGFKKRSQIVVAENNHGSFVEKSCEALACSIQAQWPRSVIDVTKLIDVDPAHVDVERALEDLKPEWQRLTRNHELAVYLESVQVLLDRSSAGQGETRKPVASPNPLHPATYIQPISPSRYPSRVRDGDDLSLPRLLEQSICRTYHQRGGLPVAFGTLHPKSANTPSRANNVRGTTSLPASGKPLLVPGGTHVSEVQKLRAIVSDFRAKTSHVHSRYADEMEASVDALQLHLKCQQKAVHITTRWIGSDELQLAKDAVRLIIEEIKAELAGHDPQAKWLRMVDLWPKMTITGLLTELRTTSGNYFGAGTKDALVSLGIAVTKFQQLLRIQDSRKRNKDQQQREELSNVGHTNWDPLKYPDWLLLEIDGDVMLREEQVQVALATIAPASGQNSVLQLLMGKGKTSCILPMVAAVLANKDDLVRVVVPRPLLLQSAQVLHAKLGTLVNRQIMHIPFSRKTPANLPLMQFYLQLQACMRDLAGVMISLPEHLLSFKLSGLQQLADGNIEVSTAMLQTQDWLDSHARDVLDECDVSLATRMQLIYPSGSQASVDGHPIRWQMIELLLHRTQDFITAVQSRFRNSVEVVSRPDGGFPLIYFLRKDAEDHLIELLVRDIYKGNFPYLPCADFPPEVQDDISIYISNASVRSEMVQRVAAFFKEKQQLMKATNLLRGLFVHRILISSLKKRWNVQYGLHATRAPIAVPYLAKGVPSVSAEWGHPDVAIILTCLSFYYQGLNTSQFKQAFEQLVKMDDPNVEYAKWVFPRAPLGLEEFSAVNAEDDWQLNNLFQLIRLNASLVNFYLNNFVFPQYAKTFSVKLQASGWNLFPSRTDTMECRVTGFSGTNDTHNLMPMLIRQADLPELAHTNAEVPYYLMASRNRGYVRMNYEAGRRWTELDLIKHLVNPQGVSKAYVRHENSIRILIDAGAQVLEHSSRDFAKAWLDEDTNAAAAVYFDDDHRAWALYRTGNRTPLLASPFADSLDRCVVYLDESHCRGTDLKLPVYGKAALTLGQHLTKDALVQAAMRLRLLGQSQSVVFYSPAEVHQSILDRLNKSAAFRPDSAAVLFWVFGQTCDILEHQEPSYFAQALQYMQQKQAKISYPFFLNNEHSRSEFLSAVLQKEALTIKDMYQPGSSRRTGLNKPSAWDASLQADVKLLQDRQKQFQDNGSAVHASVLEEVEIEQERELEIEVEHEVENVREAQQPPRFRALPVSKLHPDVEHFVEFGRLVAGSCAYHPVFSALSRTDTGLKRSVSSSMPSNLWVTEQFSRTVDVYYPNDIYVRSSQWVLWSSVSRKAILVSPEEANSLIPLLRSRCEPEGVHLIVYAAPVTRRMLHFNDLNYHATPPLTSGFPLPTWLTVELGIFSGRLHFDWREYTELLGYLGLKQDLSKDPDAHSFAAKPLTFLHEWIAVRRKGQDFEHTPMGFITTGKPLTENHAFFQTSGNETHAEIRPRIARVGSGEDEEEDKVGDSDHDDDDEFLPNVEHVDDSDTEGDNSDEHEHFGDAQESQE